MKKRISKNIISLVFGRGGELLLNFVSLTILARYLGTEQFGVFTATLAAVMILDKIIDLGFAQIIFRELSSSPKKFDFINNAFTIRLIILAVVFFLLNLISFFVEIGSDELLYSNILLINVILSFKFRNFREILEVPFKVDLRSDLIMFANIIDSLILLGLVVLAFINKLSLLIIVIFYVLANLPGFCMLLYLLYRKYGYRFRLSMNKIKWLMKESLPLTGTVLLLILFQQLDVVLLKYFVSSSQAGVYSAALRLATPLTIIPLALITTVFPIITQNKDTDKEKVVVAKRLVYKVLMAFSLIAAVFITFKAEEIVILIYGTEYSQAAAPLILIFWASIFIYMNNMSQNLMTIYNQQKYSFVFTSIIVFTNFAALYFLLQLFSSNGAAMAKLLAALSGFIYLIYKLIRLKIFVNFVSWKSMLYLLLIGILGYTLNAANVFIYTIAFMPLSIILLIPSSYFSREELEIVYKLLNEPNWIKKLILR